MERAMRRAAFWVILGVFSAYATFAQDARDSKAPFAADPAWGTAAVTTRTLSNSDFHCFDGVDIYDVDTVERYCVTGGQYGFCALSAGIDLPSGALIERYELDACDSNTTSGIFFSIFSHLRGSGVLLLGTDSYTGSSAAPGCTTFVGYLTELPPHTLDNHGNSYVARLLIPPTTGSLRFRAFRIYYKLQVSPSPATPTFADVPANHPFYRFVEALAAAGITAGCGTSPPRFCPDAPVTRGQLAVFLASALGLHWPN